MFILAEDDQTRDNNPKDFNECVSQEQLQAVVEDAQKRINEVVRKAITDTLIETLKIIISSLITSCHCKHKIGTNSESYPYQMTMWLQWCHFS